MCVSILSPTSLTGGRAGFQIKYIDATCEANAVGFSPFILRRSSPSSTGSCSGRRLVRFFYGLYPSFSTYLSTSIYADMLDHNTAAFYNAVSRPPWTVCLGWVVIACTNGYGGWLLMWCGVWHHINIWLLKMGNFPATLSLFMCLVTYAIGWITGIISSRVNSLSGSFIKNDML